MDRVEQVNQLLEAIAQGDSSALEQLVPLVYDELRVLAQRQRRRLQGGHTLNTTALVNEAYLRLVDQTKPAWENRAHFMATAARAMRHILIDYAKRQSAVKRGGGQQRIDLEDVVLFSEDRAEELLHLDEALKRLERIDERQTRIVECRFFAGLTLAETAQTLGVSVPTVTRGWRMAQAWLYREIAGAR